MEKCLKLVNQVVSNIQNSFKQILQLINQIENFIFVLKISLKNIKYMKSVMTKNMFT